VAVLLGAIAADFTGATDLCNTLVRRGMRTVQLIDMPAPRGAAPVACRSGVNAAPLPRAGESKAGGADQRNGLTIVILPICRPCAISSEYSSRHPSAWAAAMTALSQ
jgi:hypothetical protein